MGIAVYHLESRRMMGVGSRGQYREVLLGELVSSEWSIYPPRE